MVFESDARVWLDIRRGRLTFREAPARGPGEGGPGKASAVANFQRIFHVP